MNVEFEVKKSDKQILKDYLNELLDEYNDKLELDRDEINIEFNDRLKKTLGKAYIDENLIEISRMFFDKNNKRDIKDTILHELVHLRTGVGHNRAFKRFCYYLGKPGIKSSETEAKLDYKYIIECEDCGKEYKRHRKSKIIKNRDKYRCGECGGRLKLIKGRN